MAIELSPAPSRSGVIAFSTVRVIVVAAAATCGCFLGLLAELALSDRYGYVAIVDGDWGVWAGGLSAAALAFGWSLLMTLRASERPRRGAPQRVGLVPYGAGLGLLGGCVSGLCVQLTLQLSVRLFSGKNLVFGLLCGAATGLVLGLIGAVLTAIASAFAPRPR